MPEDPEGIQKQRPFKISQCFFPNTLEVVGQLGFLNTILADEDLIYYANLPDAFRYASLEDVFIRDYPRALSKLNELLDFLTTANAENLYDSIALAVDNYQEIHRDDYMGLEVQPLDGKLYLNIHNGDELVLQAQLEDTGVCWGIERFIVHYKIHGYKLELRDNLRGKQSIVIFPPSEVTSIFPQIRDKAAIAGIFFPEDNDDPVINLYGFHEFIEEERKKVMQDFFTISPRKMRLLNIYTDGLRNEEIVALETDGGIRVDRNIVTKEQLPVGIKETFSVYRVTLDSSLDISGNDLRELAIIEGVLHKRLTLVKLGGNLSTKVEYFGREHNIALELRFKDGVIDAAILNDKVYINGEFSMQLSPEGYYILVLGDSLERIPVNFSPDFSILIPNVEIEPVFEIVNNSIPLPISNFYGLGQTVSLN